MAPLQNFAHVFPPLFFPSQLARPKISGIEQNDVILFYLQKKSMLSVQISAKSALIIPEKQLSLDLPRIFLVYSGHRRLCKQAIPSLSRPSKRAEFGMSTTRKRIDTTKDTAPIFFQVDFSSK
jgi:hypothetical protein